ncbi:unnamed protein product [Moneuplotes crassus]|uniref:Thioredoxin-like fold domain-containing protein n=2 Tax=Euplotes crassus TaxID=5936 RepID=A0AAD2D4P4_EUPCR|nr:unnamed protein product [Moneuplotes crassus]|eukprot:CAMPEP_0196995266 /NCGR_PEP_ID=MMETSP1380-20130617/1414_1 /TAXON_ID=5936 /ORGANISM="Euplotes crassus, Strain CT5" /LENGTH=218 /DNA_ID=CAMNT_0042410895 /DNA_START=20 /DNA_END=676 /DNA_ORIENTATION=+
MKTAIAFAVIVALAICVPPIPSHPDGFVFSSPETKKARIDIYEDLLCIDCKHFEGPFKNFLNSHEVDGVAITDLVEVVVHIFPLPYHHHAFFPAQLGAFIADQNNNHTEFFEYSDWIFDHQDEFNSGSVELTQPQVQAKLCAEASADLAFLDESACLQEFSNNDHNNDARISFKLAAYYGVNGTPTTFLNGVEVDAPLTTQGWVNLVKPYVTSEATAF